MPAAMPDIDPHEVEYPKLLNGPVNADHRRMGKSQPDPVVPIRPAVPIRR